MPLIPDLTLRVPDGPNAGLHLFDAKLRVKALTEVGLPADDKAAERPAAFKRADVHKIHAYRDAIPDARSVWILYPGGHFGFFEVTGAAVRLGTGRVLCLRGCRKSSTGLARCR